MSEPTETTSLVELTADIVSAYIANNSVSASSLPQLIADTHAALRTIAGSSVGSNQTEAPAQAPAVSVKKSITPDFIICLEDGKKFKSLKRHLRTSYDMTPDQYREKWNLAADYPMVAPAYAAARSALAKSMGLGQQRRKAAAATKAKAPARAAKAS